MAVLFCLDQAIAASNLAVGRGAHSVEPERGDREPPEGLRVVHLLPRSLSLRAVL